MPPVITLGQRYLEGDQVSPQSLNALVDTATVSGFVVGDFNLGSIQFYTYGNTRPSLIRGAVHYDTTAGIEGLVYAFVTATNASYTSWLYALPHRECVCWASSAVSAGTPVFMGSPHAVAQNPEFTVFDGVVFPNVWQYSGASGPDSAFFVTAQSVGNNQPVRCIWAGMIPQSLTSLNAFSAANSAASAGFPLAVDFDDAGAFKFGTPPAGTRRWVFGVNTLNNTTGVGAIIWGTGAAIEEYA